MRSNLVKKQVKLQITEFFREKSNEIYYLSEFSDPTTFYSTDKGSLKNNLVLCPISSISKTERERLHDLAFEMTKTIFEKKIKFLNQNNQKIYSKQFWWILISPWLYQFINQLLLYCYIIEHALGNIKPELKLECQIIEPKYWTRYYDTIQTLNAWKNNRQNHEILSFLLWCKKDSNIIKKKISDKSVQNLKKYKLQKRCLLGKLLINLSFKIILVLNKIFHTNALGFGTPSESKFTDLNLVLRSFFFFVPIYNVDSMSTKDPVFCKGNFPKKSSILNLINDFEKVAMYAFDLFIPKIFSEDFERFSSGTLKLLNLTNFKTVASSTDWYFNERFKFIAASAVENGAKTIGMQHGGNYGIEMNHPVLEFELYKRDTYITWGWTKTDFKHYTKIKPLPSLKLLGLTRRKKKYIDQKKVLFCTNETPIFPRWLIRDDYKQGLDRISSQMEFFNELGAEIRKQTVFRLNTNDLGWDQVKNVKNRFPEIKIESFNVPFDNSLSNSSAFVTNILSTTYIQSFVANIPSILILNPELNRFTSAAQKYILALESAGVIHFSAKSAGIFFS